MEMGSSGGFTLTEVMMAIAVAAIVVTIGVPSFQTMILNSRKDTAISDLQSSLALARNNAITRRQTITVCKSNDNSSCATDGDWSQGWIVFTDPANPGVRDNDETILRAHNALKGDATYAGNDPVKDRVSFTNKGMTSGTLGTITYTDSRGSDYAGNLIISFGGQVRYEDSNAH